MLLACASSLIFVLSSIPENLLLATGETLSIFFVLSSIYFFDRRLFLSGALLGLAILTKTIFFITVPAFLLITLIKYKNTINPYLKALTGIFTPIIIFEFYRFISYGFSFDKYSANIRESIAFFQIAGSGAVKGATNILNQIVDKIQATSPNDSSVIAIILLTLIVSAVIYLICFVYKNIRTVKITKLYNDVLNNHTVSYLSLIFITWITWYVLISDKLWQRHVFPAIIFGVLAYGLFFLATLPGKHQAKIKYAVVIFVLLLACAVGYVVKPFNDRLSAQLVAINNVNEFYKDKPIYHFGWWQSPEVQFTLNRTTVNMDTISKPGTYDVIMDVLSLNEVNESQLNNRCIKTHKLNNYYTICQFRKD